MAMQELSADWYDWYNSNYQDLCNHQIPVGRNINLFTEAGEFTVPFNFIWNTRKDKIKRPTSDCKDGGLLMPHIKTLIMAQRIMCMKGCPDVYSSTWKVFLDSCEGCLFN